MWHTPPTQHTNSSSLSQRLVLPPVFPILINETQRLKSETWVIKLNLSHLNVYSIQLFLQPQQAQVSKLPILVTKDTLQLDLYQSISELSSLCSRYSPNTSLSYILPKSWISPSLGTSKDHTVLWNSPIFYSLFLFLLPLQRQWLYAYIVSLP